VFAFNAPGVPDAFARIAAVMDTSDPVTALREPSARLGIPPGSKTSAYVKTSLRRPPG
jgi:hypothetical protein